MKRYIKASYGEGLIGIWWYDMNNNSVISFQKPLDSGYSDGNYIQYSDSDNHMTLWRQAVYNNITDKQRADEIYSQGYKSLERGRVIFNLRTQCYEITCSKDIIKNEQFRKDIVNEFNLSGNRYDFVPLNHYYISKLTGNPTLDSRYYENQF